MKQKTDLKRLVNNNKTLINSISSLSVYEVVNVIIPFLLIPFLIGVLGKEFYGHIVYTQAIITFFLTVQNFGINNYAVKEISNNRDNQSIKNEIVSTIFALKGLLFVLCLALLVILTSLSYFKEYKLLLFLTMWICLLDVVFPKWYFQGVEKMKHMTTFFLLGKLISLFLILIFVKIPSDYIKVPVFHACGVIVTGGMCGYFLIKKHKINLLKPKTKHIKLTIKKCYDFFVSDIFINIFANSNKVIVGFLFGMVEVAYYDLAEKIVHVFKRVPLGIVRMAIYPRVVLTKNTKIIRNATVIMSLYSIFIIAALYLVAPQIVYLLGDSDMTPSIGLIYLLSLTILTTNISNYYLTSGFWSFGYEKIFRNIMILSSIIFIIMIFILFQLNANDILLTSSYSIIWITLLVEIYLIAHTYYAWKKQVQLKT